MPNKKATKPTKNKPTAKPQAVVDPSTPASAEDDPLLYLSQVALQLGIHRNTARAWCDEGHLPFIRMGNLRRVRQSAVTQKLRDGFTGSQWIVDRAPTAADAELGMILACPPGASLEFLPFEIVASDGHPWMLITRPIDESKHATA